MKTKRLTRSSRKNLRLRAIIGTGAATMFLLGLVAGHFLLGQENTDARYSVVSSSDRDKVRAELSSQFKKASTEDCGDNPDSNTLTERQKIFDDYLKVNKYANRAVMRGCYGTDALLAKDPVTAKWQRTAVNISLSHRANPAWQEECLIDDITTADTVVRSENSSIDTTNFVGCRQLKEREQIVDILDRSGTIRRSDITQENIDEYIRGSEEFFKQASAMNQ